MAPTKKSHLDSNHKLKRTWQEWEQEEEQEDSQSVLTESSNDQTAAADEDPEFERAKSPLKRQMKGRKRMRLENRM
jgi:hypothetical protein